MNRQLKYNGHTGSTEASVEDNCLFGRVLYIDSLVSYEGQTEEELEQDFRQAVDDFLKDERTDRPSAQAPIAQNR